MDRFKTVDDVVRWFTDGQRGDLCYDAADIRDLVERMVSLPDPFRTSWGPERLPSPANAWNWIVEHGLLVKTARVGWVTREGKMLGADWGWHDRLLYWFGMEVGAAEAAGWARSGVRGWQCRFRLSPEQVRRLEVAGHIVDKGEERIKPVWNPPLAENDEEARLKPLPPHP